MHAFLNVALPVFGIMLAGYLVGRFGILGTASSEALNGFVYYVALPALFFVAMARVPVAEVLHGPFLIAYCGGMAVTFAVAVPIARVAFPGRVSELGLHGLSAVFANTGYMGVPLLLTAFAEAGTLPGIIATVLNGAIVIAIGTAILEYDASRGGSSAAIAGDVLRGVLKSPLFLSAAAGIAISAAGLPLPAPLATFCDILGAAAAPCALFAMGLFLVGRAVTHGAIEIGWLSLLKLVVHPLVTWLIATRLVAMDPVWTASAVILAALPTGALVFVLAQRYDVYVQRSTAAILVSTLLSVITVSAVLAYYLPA